MPFASAQTVKWEFRVQCLAFVCFVAVVIAASTGYLGDRARIVLATTVIYAMLLVIFWIAGRRTLAETTSFDLVLLLIIGETTQNAMIGTDTTIGSAAIAILSLVSLDMAISYLKKALPVFDHLLEGRAVLLIRDGKPIRSAIDANSLDEEDIREAARLSHGLERMEDVRQATLERDGHISIVPWRTEAR